MPFSTTYRHTRTRARTHTHKQHTYSYMSFVCSPVRVCLNGSWKVPKQSAHPTNTARTAGIVHCLESSTYTETIIPQTLVIRGSRIKTAEQVTRSSWTTSSTLRHSELRTLKICAALCGHSLRLHIHTKSYVHLSRLALFPRRVCGLRAFGRH